MKKILYFLLLTLPFVFTSCGDDDDPSNPLARHTFRYQVGNEYIQYTFWDGMLGTTCDIAVVSSTGSAATSHIYYDYSPSTNHVKIYEQNLLDGYYDPRTKSITDVDGLVYKRIELDPSKLETPDQATSVARDLWSLMLNINGKIDKGYRYTDYEFSYGGGTVKVTGQKADDSQGWTISQFTEVVLTNVSGFSGKFAYEDNDTHNARSTYSGAYYKRTMKLKSAGGYPIRYNNGELNASFSVDLYKDNSERYSETIWVGSTAVSNESRYGSTSPVSGSLKADTGFAFTVTWR